MAQLSGAYEFRSEVDQVTNYQPRLSNYAKPSIHEQYVVEGSVDESNQTPTMPPYRTYTATRTATRT